MPSICGYRRRNYNYYIFNQTVRCKQNKLFVHCKTKDDYVEMLQNAEKVTTFHEGEGETVLVIS